MKPVQAARTADTNDFVGVTGICLDTELDTELEDEGEISFWVQLLGEELTSSFLSELDGLRDGPELESFGEISSCFGMELARLT